MIRLTDEEIWDYLDIPPEDRHFRVSRGEFSSFKQGNKAQLKKVVELLKDALENDFVMTYCDEDHPSEPTISPQRINEIIEALQEEVK